MFFDRDVEDLFDLAERAIKNLQSASTTDSKVSNYNVLENVVISLRDNHLKDYDNGWFWKDDEVVDREKELEDYRAKQKEYESLKKNLVFTPTENLVVEVLVSRYRLGETLWTFDSRVSGQVKSLEEKGVVYSMDGNVDKTVRAGLTSLGIDLFASYPYDAPVFKEIAYNARRELKEQLREDLKNSGSDV